MLRILFKLGTELQQVRKWFGLISVIKYDSLRCTPISFTHRNMKLHSETVIDVNVYLSICVCVYVCAQATFKL